MATFALSLCKPGQLLSEVGMKVRLSISESCRNCRTHCQKGAGVSEAVIHCYSHISTIIGLTFAKVQANSFQAYPGLHKSLNFISTKSLECPKSLWENWDKVSDLWQKLIGTAVAQVEFIKSKNVSHPSHWAPLQIIKLNCCVQTLSLPSFSFSLLFCWPCLLLLLEKEGALSHFSGGRRRWGLKLQEQTLP